MGLTSSPRQGSRMKRWTLLVFSHLRKPLRPADPVSAKRLRAIHQHWVDAFGIAQPPHLDAGSHVGGPCLPCTHGKPQIPHPFSHHAKISRPCRSPIFSGTGIRIRGGLLEWRHEGTGVREPQRAG